MIRLSILRGGRVLHIYIYTHTYIYIYIYIQIYVYIYSIYKRGGGYC